MSEASRQSTDSNTTLQNTVNTTSVQPDPINPSALRVTSPLVDRREPDLASNNSNSPQQWAQQSTSSSAPRRQGRQRTTTFEDGVAAGGGGGTRLSAILETNELTDNVVTNQSATNQKNSPMGRDTNHTDTTSFAPEDDETTTDVNFTLTDRRTGTSAGLEDFDTSEDPDATGNESTTTGPSTADDEEDIVTATSVATTAVSTVRAAYHRASAGPSKKRFTSPPSPNPKHADPNNNDLTGAVLSRRGVQHTSGASPAEENIPLNFGDDTSEDESLSSFASTSGGDGEGRRKASRGAPRKGTRHSRQHSSMSRQSTGVVEGGKTAGKKAARRGNKGAKEDDIDESSSADSTSTASSSSASSTAKSKLRKLKVNKKSSKDGSAYVGSRDGNKGNYFGEYGDLSVHQLMLSDGPRMRFYHSVLGDNNPASAPTKGSVVVEVGCGSGVLSVWASKFGQARRVIAFEGSSDMASIASAVAVENGVHVVKVKADPSATTGKQKKPKPSRQAAAPTSIWSHQKEDEDEAETTAPSFVVVDGISDVVVDQGVDAFIQRFLQNEKYRPASTALAAELPYLPVSALYSEWMGFYLLHECMLPSVIRMRDFLTQVNSEVERKNAEVQTSPADLGSASASYGPPVMVPNSATLYVAPVTLLPWYERRFAKFWSSVSPSPNPRLLAECLGDHGINDDDDIALGANSAQSLQSPKSLSMNVIAKLQLEGTLTVVEESGTPLVEILPSSSLLHEPKVFATIDLQRCSQKGALECVGEAVFNFGDSTISMNRASASQHVSVDGFCVWFDVAQRADDARDISQRNERNKVLASLPTGPLDSPTHWKQSTMLIPSQMRAPIPPTSDTDGPLSVSTLVADRDTMRINVAVKRVKGREYTLEYELS